MKSAEDWVGNREHGEKQKFGICSYSHVPSLVKTVREIQADALRKVLETAEVGLQNSSNAMEGAEHDEFFFSKGAALAYTYMKNYLNMIIKELESQE